MKSFFKVGDIFSSADLKHEPRAVVVHLLADLSPLFFAAESHFMAMMFESLWLVETDATASRIPFLRHEIDSNGASKTYHGR